MPSAYTTNQHHASALSVSDLNRQVKRMLEVSYAQVWVTGEISGLSKPGSGHWYFNLKDSKSQIRCAMFRGANQRLRFSPKDGDEVILRGKLTLYEGRGDYQLIVDSMEPAGLGQLQAAFEELKRKLAAEGLFDSKRKRPIPAMPSRVCVITSRSGAVIHDIIHVSQRRFPALEIVLIPVSVQGADAAKEIATAIELANREQIADVLIVGRGGGSLEDLWAFNEEPTARAIFASTIPVISAVGHEVDVSIADMVADVRAATPSAAAELVTPDQYELSQRIDEQQRRLSFLIQNALNNRQQIQRSLSARLQHPGQTLKHKESRAQAAEKAIHQLMRYKIEQRALSLVKRQSRLHSFRPDLLLEQAQKTFQELFARSLSAHKNKYESTAHQVALAANKLNLVSPLSTMQRGYSILLDQNGVSVKDAKQVEVGDTLAAKLAQGSISVKVLEQKQND